MAKINAECPTCKAALPVIVGSAATVRVAVCGKCGDEWQYSAWVIFSRVDRTFTKVELDKIAAGHHVRPVTEA